VELVNAGDGTNRLFIVQQRGLIYVIENSPSVSTRKVFLDLSDRVSPSGSEAGLLGLAFHPNYNSNGYLYAYYTTGTSSLTSYLVRYQVSPTNPDSAMRSSELVLMTFAQPFTNHNGGKIAFGPDRYLYIGLGDGGSGNDPGNRAQNRSVILGKILRIDVDNTAGGNNYAIPNSNPFVGNPQGWREEIFAYGMRNPWKFSFDAHTGTLWCGDVGQDAREEVDTIISGGNYGWRLMEGFLCTPGANPNCLDTAGLLRPVWDYPNSGADVAVTGGYVYRGAQYPDMAGKYFFADYGSGKTWSLTLNSVGLPTVQLLTDEAFAISTFGVDEMNELYLCSYSTAGRIYKLVGPTGVGEGDETPRQFYLGQNYPNPFNPTTEIRYQTPEVGHVTLKVFDVLGREVATLVDEVLSAATHTRTFDATGLASGVYYYRLVAGSHIQTKKMVLAR
jgi:glucose/arabinose dehydrogenase